METIELLVVVCPGSLQGFLNFILCDGTHEYATSVAVIDSENSAGRISKSSRIHFRTNNLGKGITPALLPLVRD